MPLSANYPSFDSGYAAGGHNLQQKGFMQLTPVVSFKDPFWYNLCRYRQIAKVLTQVMLLGT
jgi:hypothetical protein